MWVPHPDVSEHLLSWMDSSEKLSSSQTYPLTGREEVPALEVPLSNLHLQEDEMLSWIQYPLEDSFDKNYCSEELYMEAPISHSSLVHDAFLNLTLREGEKLHSAGLRSHSSLPSDFNVRERGAEGHPPTAMHAWGVAGPHDTKESERVLAANTAMAMGAQRASGFLFQSGAEAFNTARTSAQPYMAKRTHNVLPTQETGGSTSSFIPYAVRVGDTRSRLQPSFQCVPSTNFPLFSRAVVATKANLQQAGYNNSRVSERAKLVSAMRGKGGDSASNCEQTTGVASSTSPAHPTVAPVVTKGSSVCLAQSSTTGVTGTISCKLEAEAVGSTHIEGISRTLSTPRAEKGLPSSAAASPGLASGSLVGCIGSTPKIETGRPYRIPQEGEPFTCAEPTATTDMDSSIYSELARQDSETSQNLACSRMFLHVGITASESKLREAVEMGDVTMVPSPSRGSGDSTEKSIKEAAPFSMKRKAHPAEDSEIESKVPQGCTRGGKRTRAAEIHNLSERKRRNRINVKMKALQDLIPNAIKTDKASILDEAIEYMKMLQSQVQLISMRTGMVGMPMVLPRGIPSASMQQRPRSPHLNMDLGTGLAFRMGMGNGLLDPASVNRHSLSSAAPVVGHPLSGSGYSAPGLQLFGSHSGIQEAHDQSQGLVAHEVYTNLPVQQQQQQHLHWSTNTNADMFGAHIIQQQQQQQQPLQLHLGTPSDAMQ